MDILGNLANKMRSDQTSETYFYWLFFGKAGYIGSKTFLRVLPCHDIFFNVFQLVVFMQMAFFFALGPMPNITFFCYLGMLCNLLLIVSSAVFLCKKEKEVVNGKGFGFWFYYMTRLLCTLICTLLSFTFLLTWLIRVWIVNKFDPTLEQNIVNDGNSIMNNLDNLSIARWVECIGYAIMIFHYSQTLYMMRLFTESFDDWTEKSKLRGSNL